MRIAAALLLVAAAVPPARALDITRSCFPGFCIESRASFTAVGRRHVRGWHVLRVSRTQSTVYAQAGPAPEFPHCGALCTVESADGEQRAFQHHTRRLVGRLVGPLAACRDGEADFFVTVFVYDASASPDWFEVVRDCR